MQTDLPVRRLKRRQVRIELIYPAFKRKKNIIWLFELILFGIFSIIEINPEFMY